MKSIKQKKKLLNGITVIMWGLFLFCLMLIGGCKSERPDNVVGYFEKGPYLKQARYGHTATLFDDGNVLIVGGNKVQEWGRAETAEIYLAKENKFKTIRGLNIPRSNHIAIKLKDRFNRMKVLFFCGEVGAKNTDIVEEYDPITMKFKIVGKLLEPRGQFARAVLLDNGKIFIYGGSSYDKKGYSYAELYDPETNTSKYTCELQYKTTEDASIVKLKDGRVLIAISNRFSPEEVAFNQEKYKTDISYYEKVSQPNRDRSIEIYNPYTDTSSVSYVLKEHRNRASLMTLPDGKVLFVGGYDSRREDRERALSTLELYDPIKEKTEIVGDLGFGVYKGFGSYSMNLVLVKERYVMIIDGNYEGINSIKAYDIEKQKVLDISSMNVLRVRHSLTKLLNGDILVVGGQDKKSCMSEIFRVKK